MPSIESGSIPTAVAAAAAQHSTLKKNEQEKGMKRKVQNGKNI